MDIRAIHTPPLTVETQAHRQTREATVPSDSRNQQPASVQEQPASPQQHPVLTAEEQRYFEGLFPGSATDVRGHQAYTGGGTPSTAASGTIVDRRV